MIFFAASSFKSQCRYPLYVFELQYVVPGKFCTGCSHLIKQATHLTMTPDKSSQVAPMHLVCYGLLLELTATGERQGNAYRWLHIVGCIAVS